MCSLRNAVKIITSTESFLDIKTLMTKGVFPDRTVKQTIWAKEKGCTLTSLKQGKFHRVSMQSFHRRERVFTNDVILCSAFHGNYRPLWTVKFVPTEPDKK